MIQVLSPYGHNGKREQTEWKTTNETSARKKKAQKRIKRSIRFSGLAGPDSGNERGHSPTNRGGKEIGEHLFSAARK